MDVLLVYVPFCSPASPPYSLTYLSSFLKVNSDLNIALLDLNAAVHQHRFGEEQERIKLSLRAGDFKEYSVLIHEYKKLLAAFSKEENQVLRAGKESEAFRWCVDAIMKRGPQVVSLSVVYNSQAFFALALARKLKEEGVKVIVGGPAVTRQLKEAAVFLPHEVALLEELVGEKKEMDLLDCRRCNDFAQLDSGLYLAPELVIPLRTASTCYYQQCAFCTHHGNAKYVEYDLQDIRDTIVASDAKLVFFVDDMIYKERLLALAKVLEPLGVQWMCQLRPTKEFDEELMRTLYAAGLRMVMWGVESGSDRLLTLMRKGTNAKDTAGVLRASKAAGIVNVPYILFGFPSETKEEFLETIHFLEDNRDAIDLVSTSSFGLQEGAPILEDPKAYGVAQVTREARQMLPDKLGYEVKAGLHTSEARVLQKKFKKTIDGINRFPREMNMYREHMLFVVAKGKR